MSILKIFILLISSIVCTTTAGWADEKQDCTKEATDNYCYSPPGPMLDLDSYPFQWSSCGVKGTLALTFDDGPSDNTGTILDILKKYKMKATFFLIGYKMRGNKAIVQRIVNEGHQIGSHTQDHLWLTSLTNEQIVAQIVEWENTLISYNFTGPLSGSKIPNYFRAPHGAVNSKVYDILKKYGYTIMNWGFNSEDSDGLSPEQLYKVYVSHLGDGSRIHTKDLSLIIQQHDNVDNLAEIFPKVANYFNRILLSKGVRAVTVSDCMGLGIPPYRPKRGKTVPTHTPTHTPNSDPYCLKGIKGSGDKSYAVCCKKSCGVCGGNDCSNRPGGEADCCATTILDSGIFCDMSVAPCIIPTHSPTHKPTHTPNSDPHCLKGIKGAGDQSSVVCCKKSCGVCGGDGCSNRPGGEADCCATEIVNSDILCAHSNAPCIVTPPKN
jgi:peptidoglycan/xylan/chitin deacetylase (PgdA/CDA1 family)